MIFPARWTGVVGRKEAGNPIAVVQFAQIAGTGNDVVMDVVGISAEMVALSQCRPGLRHDLHQAHRPFRRYRVYVAEALGAHHGPHPRCRNAEALRGLGHERCKACGIWNARDMMDGRRLGAHRPASRDHPGGQTSADQRDAKMRWLSGSAGRKGEGGSTVRRRSSAAGRLEVKHGQSSSRVHIGSARPAIVVRESSPK